MKKLLSMTSLVTTVILSLGMFTFSANASTLKGDVNVTKNTIISTTTYDAIHKDNVVEFKKDILYDGMCDKNGKLQKLDKEKLKKALLERWNKEPDINKNNIANIDSIVNDAVAQSESSSEGIIQPLLFDSYWWQISPYIYETKNWIAWNNWVTENNYNSSVDVTVTTTQSSTAATSIGFTGDVDLKVKLGFSASYEQSYSSSISQGATIPKWTIWSRRPYIQYREDSYVGYYAHQYYDLIRLGYVTEYTNKYGDNNVLLNKATEYWSSTNSSHQYSTPPSPPSGQPNVN